MLHIENLSSCRTLRARFVATVTVDMDAPNSVRSYLAHQLLQYVLHCFSACSYSASRAARSASFVRIVASYSASCL